MKTQVHLICGPLDSRTLEVEEELSTLVVPLRIQGQELKAVFHRTDQHTADGYRIYCRQSSHWIDHMTLGWVGPEWFHVRSDFDSDLLKWRVRIEGLGSAITLMLTPIQVVTEQHLDMLDAAARRLSRAGSRPRPLLTAAGRLGGL
jgi:hypothetical protein